MTQPQNAQPQTPTPANASATTFSEAPYSWNVRVIGAEGFEEQYTVRAISVDGFTRRVDAMKKSLAEQGYAPVIRYSNGPRAAAANTPTQEQAPLCAIHKTPLAKRQGKNGSFWSCPKKLDDGTYCPYRPPKA